MAISVVLTLLTQYPLTEHLMMLRDSAGPDPMPTALPEQVEGGLGAERGPRPQGGRDAPAVGAGARLADGRVLGGKLEQEHLGARDERQPARPLGEARLVGAVGDAAHAALEVRHRLNSSR